MESTPTDPIMKQIEEDLAAVIRVRNRLAQSSDTALPKILAGLLPRLLARLEQNTTTTSSEREASIRNQMKINLLGTLAHALERLRGNKDIPAAQWLPEILISLETTSGLVRTLTLTFLQVGLPRCTKADLAQMEKEQGVSVVGSLLRTVDRLYRSLCETSTEHDADITKGSQTDLRSASWLCFDAIAVLAGVRPLVDWDVDAHYDQDDGLGTGDEGGDAFEFGDAVASTIAQQAVNEDGAGVFDMFLDLFLFSPHILHENMEPTRGLSPEGIHRMCHRLQGNHQSWTSASESYLRSIKSTCFRYLTSQEHPSLLLTSAANKTRALMLAVIFSSSNSNVGVIATEYMRSPAAREGGPFGLMCSLLILVLGDDAVRPMIDKHSSQANRSEILPRPVAGSILARLPLPASAASRVFRFMHENLKLSPSIEIGELHLFLQLLVAVSVRDEFLAKEFWAIRLIHKVCKQIDSLGLEETDWIHDFYKQSLHVALEFLSVVSEPAEERQAGRAPQGQRQMHPVAPAVNGQADPMVRFERRNARFNQMMTTHRRSLRKKRLRHDDAVETREDAYDLVDRLAPKYGIRSSDGCVSFDIPIKLFQCATYEDDFMQPRVVNCLRTLLSAYQSEISSANESSATDTSFLLPALIGAACCDSPSARLAAAQWAEGLLVLTDALAAYHVASFLSDDTDPMVANIGRTISTDFQSKTFCRMNIDPPQTAEFIDFSTDVGMQQVTEELNQRIAALSSELDIPSSATSLLLQEFDFDSASASEAFIADSANVKLRCGIEGRCRATDQDVEMHADEKLSCGICYEDECNASDMYSLPCGHRYCLPCWHEYIENQLSQGPTPILTASCPDTKCKERITGLDILNVAPDFVPKWKKSLLQSFVERDQRYRFCPGTDCKMVVHVDNGEPVQQPYSCEGCHESFCFACGELPHVPARCSDFAEWNKIFGSSKFWIQKNTKPCPGCNSPVVKDGGCNHMQCSRCHYDFCWLCLARLDTHLMAHVCNQYDPAEHADSDDERRDLFFTERFQAHEEAEYFAKKQVEASDQLLEKLLERFYLESEDIEGLSTAGATLLRARGFLKYSYVAAYGLRLDKKHRSTFEKHQGVLELFTEQLSRLSEMPLEVVYMERGESGLVRHLRAIAFYSSSVERYIERTLSFAKGIQDTA